jgi:hypothetical protein
MRIFRLLVLVLVAAWLPAVQAVADVTGPVTPLGGTAATGSMTSITVTATAPLVATSCTITTTGTCALSWSGQFVAAQMPAFTGDCTNTAGSLALTCAKENGNALPSAATVLGDTWYGSAANTLLALAGNTTATKNFLTQTGTGSVSAIPAWGTIANTDVSGLGNLSTQSGTFSGTSSGTNTGDQTITLTGNVTGSGPGSFVATIGALQVVNSMIAAGTIDLTAKVTGVLPLANGGSGSALGGVRVIAQSGIPLLLPSSGTVGSTGTVTALTAMPAYATGQPCYAYLPAGYLSSSGAGSAAGVYYGTFASTTSIQFYNNLLAAGSLPVAIVSPTAFSGLSGGSGAQATGAYKALLTVSVPANSLGANGRIEVNREGVVPNNANAKYIQLTWSGTTVNTATLASTAGGGAIISIQNMGVTNAQYAQNGNTGDTGAAVSSALPAGDTTGAVNLVFNEQMATATDFVIMNSYSVKLFPAP